MTRSFLLAFFLLCCLTSPVVARDYVVSPSGDDQAVGDADHPLNTISRAAELAMPGDTVLVKPGVYRERVAPPRGGEPGRPITYRAETPGTAFIKGSDVWTPQWTKYTDTVYYAVPDEAMFNDDCYVDEANPLRVPLASTPYGRHGRFEHERFGYGNPELSYTCGQLFVDDKPLVQAPFLSEVEKQPGTWTFDQKTGRVYVNFGDSAPSQRMIELTTRRRIFAPHAIGLGHIVVDGFVMEHCGNQYPTNFWTTPKWGQAGALGLRGGHHWIVRNNVIRYANTTAMDIGTGGGDNERNSPQPDDASQLGCDTLIERNYIVDNGAAGIIGSKSTRMVIRDNAILRNNTHLFKGEKRYEHAGIKCHGIRDAVIERNYVADNPLNDGIWLDNQFPGTRVTKNVVVNNGNKGIFLEMSDYKFDTAMLDNNILVGNELIQFYVHDASGSTVMHNLIANSPKNSKHGQGAYIFQVTARTRTGYHSLFNNLFVHHRKMLDINYPSHRSGPQRLDHNVYDASPEDRTFIINSAADKPSPWTKDEFLELVDSDLGDASPGVDALEGDKPAAMTLNEWRAFWKHHGLANDVHSVLQQGMQVAYNPATFTLTVTLPFNPTTVGSTDHEWIDTDFFGQPIPQDGTATPGPFQDLKEGVNTYRIWNGLPTIGAGKLPEPSVFE